MGLPPLNSIYFNLFLGSHFFSSKGNSNEKILIQNQLKMELLGVQQV